MRHRKEARSLPRASGNQLQRRQDYIPRKKAGHSEQLATTWVGPHTADYKGASFTFPGFPQVIEI